MDAAGLVSPGAENTAKPCSDSGFSGVYPGGRVRSPIVRPEVEAVIAGVESVKVSANLRRERDFLELAALAAGEGNHAAVAVDMGGVELEHYAYALPAEIKEMVEVAELGIGEECAEFGGGVGARSPGKVTEVGVGEPVTGVVGSGHEPPRVEGIEQCANVCKLGINAGGFLAARAKAGRVVID